VVKSKNHVLREKTMMDILTFEKLRGILLAKE
jgi:hypothetical protein